MAKPDKKELILNAAREIFAEKGYHTATSEEIAKRAGVGKDTIYQYFESKQAIFAEMHQRYLKEYSDSVVALIDENGSFEENMRRVVSFHVDNMQQLSRYGMQMMTEIHPPTISTEEGQMLAESFRKMMNIEQYHIITDAQKRGEVIDIDADLVISCMVGMFIGVSHMIGPAQLNDEQKTALKEQLLQMVLNGLVKK